MRMSVLMSVLVCVRLCRCSDVLNYVITNLLFLRWMRTPRCFSHEFVELHITPMFGVGMSVLVRARTCAGVHVRVFASLTRPHESFTFRA